MPALNYHRTQLVYTSLARQASKYQSHFNLYITNDEVLQAIAPPSDRELLCNFSNIAKANSTGEVSTPIEWGIDNVKIAFRMNSAGGTNTPFMPRYPMKQADMPAELEARITKYLTDRWEAAKAFGVARYLIGQLIELTPSPTALRTIFPAFLFLLQDDVELAGVRDRCLEFKPSRSAPAIPFHLREAARASATLLSSCNLIEPSDYKPPAGCAGVTLITTGFDYNHLKLVPEFG